jgi:hypothetical protein
MPPKTIPCVTVLYLDFDRLSQSDDRTIIDHMRFALRNRRKRLFPKSVKWDRCRVNRDQNTIAIRLYNGEAETARFGFARTQI